MIQLIGTFVCVAVIIWLFYLDRDASVKTSKALWIPTVWLIIIASRTLSAWLQPNATTSLTERYTEGNPLDAAVYGLLIAAGLLVLNFRSREVGRFLRDNAAILLFFTYCALSALWSDQSLIALKRWSKSVGDLVMVMVVLTDGNPLVATKRLFARVTFVLLPLSVLLIIGYPSLGSAYNPLDGVTMYFGVATFKNLLGMISMVFGLASVWSFLDAYEKLNTPHRKRHLIAHGLMIVTAVGLIVRADSMTSLACLILGIVVMVMISQSWIARWPAGVHVIIWTAVGLPLFAVFVDTVGTLVRSLGRNPTLTGRTAIWKAVLSLQTNPFVGTGFESFWLGSRLENVWSMTFRGVQEAHNGYLELYLNLGWVGLVLLGWMIASGYQKALFAFRQNAHSGRLRLAYITAALILSLTEAGFRMLSPIWFAFLLAIAGVGLGGEPREIKPTRELSWVRAGDRKPIRILR